MKNKEISPKIKIYQKGQIAVTVILIMVIALTIGLSISGRSVSDIKMSAQVEESQRAFSAAEAGIEAALYSDQPGSSVVVGNAIYTVKIAENPSDAFLYPGLVTHDNLVQIWLSDPGDGVELYNADTIQIAWGNPNSGWRTSDNTPAIEAIIIYKDGSDYKFGKYSLDPRDNRENENNFCHANCSGVSEWKTDASTVVNGSPLQFSAQIDLSPFRDGTETKKLQILRVRLMYNSTEQLLGLIGVGEPIPAQGKAIQSTGVAGETTRKVEVFEFYPQVPPEFDFALFSTSNLKKQ